MAKRRSFTISDKTLGIAIFIGLILQYVLPAAGLRGFGSVATLIYLFVAIYLVFLS